MYKKNLLLLGVMGGGGINWEIGIDINTILYIKHATDSLCCTPETNTAL